MFKFLRALSLYSLLVVSLGLFVLNFFNPLLFSSVRDNAMGGIGRVVIFVDTGIGYVKDASKKIGYAFTIYQDNEALRRKQQDYDKLTVDLVILQDDISRLKEILKYNERYGTPDGMMARIVARSGGVYDYTFLLNRGTVDGVYEGQAIVANGAMIGYISDVYETTSRGVYITNINTAIPVKTDRGDRGIVFGDGPRSPVFLHEDNDSVFEVGDVVYSSGDGGAFPVGLLIGRIESIHGKDNMRITPQSSIHNLRFVYILRYHSQLYLHRGSQ